jgi:predicted acetyltransferase
MNVKQTKSRGFMNLEVQPAALSDKPVLRNLLELCQHDYSEYDGEDVDEHGLFGYRYLDPYWTEPERHPFLVRVDGRLAGFVLVRQIDTHLQQPVYSIAEFFIMRKYRRQGVGQQVACSIFDLFPGQWSVCQEPANLPAQNFWRRVIDQYTEGDYTDRDLQTDEWHGPCQRFESRAIKH